MDFHRRFTVLMCTPAFDPDDLEGARVNQIVAAVEQRGFEVVRARRVEDASIAVQTDAAVGCLVVDWGKRGLDGKAAALIDMMRRRGLEMPIVIMVRRKRLEDIPVELLDFIDGYVFLSEEMGLVKPDPAFFAPVLRALGEPDRSRVLMVGDNLLTDIQGGKNAGLDTAWFNPRRLPGDPAVVPTWEADGFPALRALILGDSPHTNASTQIT